MMSHLIHSNYAIDVIFFYRFFHLKIFLNPAVNFGLNPKSKPKNLNGWLHYSLFQYNFQKFTEVFKISVLFAVVLFLHVLTH